MDGWDKESTSGGPADAPYAYVPQNEVKPYWDVAKQYVLADRMFTSNFDASFVAHQYAIAAYASNAVDLPHGLWGCLGGRDDFVSTLTTARTYGANVSPCFDNPTIGSAADAADLTWRYYTGAIGSDGGVWSAYQAIDPIYNGPDWQADVINPQSQFLTDIAAGKLANITWITPTSEASDHAGVKDGNAGPAWVASIVDAVGQSQFWNSTAIFIMWDDWGGWYDPVPPPYADYDGLGFRVPLIVVSPYAKQRYVTHVQYETASVLRYIEDNFGLAQLARSDARANDPASDAFDYGQKARRFTKIAGAKPAAYWRSLERASPYHGLPKAVMGDD
jgi:phospholipase C